MPYLRLYPQCHTPHRSAPDPPRGIAESGGGWCIEQKDLDPEVLAGRLLEIMAEPESLKSVADCAKEVGVPEAVILLADLVEELAQVS